MPWHPDAQKASLDRLLLRWAEEEARKRLMLVDKLSFRNGEQTPFPDV